MSFVLQICVVVCMISGVESVKRDGHVSQFLAELRYVSVPLATHYAKSIFHTVRHS